MRTGVVVIGGGAAGLAAATTVAAAGVAVVLLSDGPPGGDCTWHGCVPTKSLLEAAAAGMTATGAVAHARDVVARLARTENEVALQAVGVTVVRARGRLAREDDTAPVTVSLAGGEVLRPELGIVLATGSRPVPAARAGLPHPLPPGCRVTTTEGWLDALAAHLAQYRPGPVVVVGGGPSGVELAQALARLGAGGEGEDAGEGEGGTVTLLEQGGLLLPGLPGAGEVVAASLRADGVVVRTDADPAALTALVVPRSLVLLATGREPVLDGLGDMRVERSATGVVVDAALRTSLPAVCAAGDVMAVQPSTHVAAASGRVAAATLLGRPLPFEPTWAPRVVYTDPEVAAVGAVPGPPGSRTVRVPVSRSDRAAVSALPDGRTRYRSRGGFAQVWVTPHPEDGFDRGGVVAGALVVAPHAGELISEVALAGRLGLDVVQWCGGQVGVGATAAGHAYPTWSWLWQAAADRLLGR